MIELCSKSVSETVEIGEKVGELLKSGDVICLYGDLGVGKTALVQGISKALQIKENITSPTYTIINEYNDAYIPLFHLDVYRIGYYNEMYDIGFDEYLYGDGIVVIEWANIIENLLPEERINIHIKKNSLDVINGRLIKIDFIGKEYDEYEKKFNTGMITP